MIIGVTYTTIIEAADTYQFSIASSNNGKCSSEGKTAALTSDTLGMLRDICDQIEILNPTHIF